MSDNDPAVEAAAAALDSIPSYGITWFAEREFIAVPLVAAVRPIISDLIEQEGRARRNDEDDPCSREVYDAYLDAAKIARGEA